MSPKAAALVPEVSKQEKLKQMRDMYGIQEPVVQISKPKLPKVIEQWPPSPKQKAVPYIEKVTPVEPKITLPEVKQTPEMKRIKAEQEQNEAPKAPSLYGFYSKFLNPFWQDVKEKTSHPKYQTIKPQVRE